MKKRLFIFLVLILVFVSAFSAAEGKGSKKSSSSVTMSTEQKTGGAKKKEKKAESIEISGSHYVAKGKKISLTAKVLPAKANQEITWKTSDKKIATVNKKGVVTGKKAGNVTITAVSKADKKITASIKIQVNPEPVKHLAITEVWGYTAKDNMKVLQAAQINLEESGYLQDDFIPTDYQWTCSDPSVAELQTSAFRNACTLKAKKPGKVTITVTAMDGSGLSASETYEFDMIFEEDSLEKRVKKIVKECVKPGMSDLEKAKALHNWIVDNATYTYGYYDAEEILFFGRGVCDAYAKAYQLLLDEAGIPNDFVRGAAYGSSHGWNLMKIGGKWLYVDSTWDDTAGERYGWFMLNDKEMWKDHWFYKCGKDDCVLEVDSKNESAGLIHIRKIDEFGKTAKVVKAYVSGGKSVIPSKVEFIGKTFQVNTICHDVYSNKTALKEISIPEGITNIELTAFYGCTNLKKLSLPESLKKIDRAAFGKCNSLESVTIPGKVSEMGENIFRECKNLEEVRISKGITTIPFGMFADCQKLKKVSLPKGLKSIQEQAFENCTSLEELTLPEGIKEIGKGAFRGCSKLKKINLPGSLTSISEDAFEGCTSLKSISIPSFEIIGAIKEMTSLEKVTILEGNEIPDKCFSDCKSLREIILPETLQSIGDSAFSGCENLKSITIPEKTTKFGAGVFFRCTSLENVKLPEGILSIPSSMFRDCSSLKSIDIPESVTEIGYYAFSQCVSLKEFIWPGQVAEIEDGTFLGCEALTLVTLSEGVSIIGNSAFEDCGALTEISLPDSITCVCTNAFRNCTGLKKISIPDKKIDIRLFAFSNCTLQEVYYAGSQKSWTENGFSSLNLFNNAEIIFAKAPETTDEPAEEPERVTHIMIGCCFPDSVFKAS